MNDERYLIALDALSERSRRIRRVADERFVRVTRCHWSARKRRAVDRYTTLYRWVVQMQRTAPKAWEQATMRGLRVDGRSVRFRGRPVTGARLMKPLHELLEHPSVQAFERHAATGALSRFEALELSPGRWGRHLLGCGLQDGEVRYGRVRFQLEAPAELATVGQAFGNSEGFAQAVAEALEAPDLFVAAAWRASASGRNARPTAKGLLAEVTRRMRSAIKTGALPLKSTPYSAKELAPFGLAEPLESLQRQIWPAPESLEPGRVVEELSRLTALRRSPLRPRTAWSLADG